MKQIEKKASQLYLLHYDLVLRLAFHYLPIAGLTEDIAHQVFIEFLVNASRWDLDNDVRPLLNTITRNVAMRYRKEKYKTMPEVIRKVYDHLQAVTEESLAIRLERDEVYALRECIDQLPEKSRGLLEEHYHAGVPLVSIAKNLRVKDSRIRQILCRIRTKLRECVENLMNENMT